MKDQTSMIVNVSLTPQELDDLQKLCDAQADVVPVLPVVTVLPRLEVQWFADRMEDKLKANEFKGGWSDEKIQNLYELLNDESYKLLESIDQGILRDKWAEVINYATNMGNYAMMIADVARKRLEDK